MRPISRSRHAAIFLETTMHACTSELTDHRMDRETWKRRHCRLSDGLNNQLKYEPTHEQEQYQGAPETFMHQRKTPTQGVRSTKSRSSAAIKGCNIRLKTAGIYWQYSMRDRQLENSIKIYQQKAGTVILIQLNSLRSIHSYFSSWVSPNYISCLLKTISRSSDHKISVLLERPAVCPYLHSLEKSKRLEHS